MDSPFLSELSQVIRRDLEIKHPAVVSSIWVFGSVISTPEIAKDLDVIVIYKKSAESNSLDRLLLEQLDADLECILCSIANVSHKRVHLTRLTYDEAVESEFCSKVSAIKVWQDHSE
jgi:hypothetical protein